ncbi:MAG TPA: iron ABC transporter substrate-binding protein [Acidimicrobiia bacterium]|nr:iron ABC transporter substrate-binding protein [Acidimicrobiia bacterium]
MHPRSRALLSVGLAVVSVAALAACGGSDGGRLTVYSGRTENLVGPLLEQFSDESGVAIDVLYGDSADLAVQIDTEGDQSPADVFISQSPGAVGYLDGEGRLVPLDDAALALVDERFRAADGEWVGLSGRVRVVVYNRDRVAADELPTSVFDLVDDAYAGRVAVAPTNGSFQDFVTGMRELVGDERTLAWLEGLVANDVRTYPNNDAIRQAVERGDVDFGLINHYYNERAKIEDPGVPTENHLLDADDPGTMVLVTAAAVLDTAGDRRADAERLIEFLLSRDAQEFFAGETLEYPLAAGVDPVVADLPPLADIAAPRLDLDALGGGLQRTRELIRESGLERA